MKRMSIALLAFLMLLVSACTSESVDIEPQIEVGEKLTYSYKAEQEMKVGIAGIGETFYSGLETSITISLKNKTGTSYQFEGSIVEPIVLLSDGETADSLTTYCVGKYCQTFEAITFTATFDAAKGMCQVSGLKPAFEQSATFLPPNDTILPKLVPLVVNEYIGANMLEQFVCAIMSYGFTGDTESDQYYAWRADYSGLQTYAAIIEMKSTDKQEQAITLKAGGDVEDQHIAHMHFSQASLKYKFEGDVEAELDLSLTDGLLQSGELKHQLKGPVEYSGEQNLPLNVTPSLKVTKTYAYTRQE